MESPGLLQIILAMITLIAALSVVLSKNPVVSSICLMATLFSTGLLYFGMGAYFIGAVQILIYAGAIAVLFVFIQMLLDLKPLRILIPGRKWVLVSALVAGISFELIVMLAVTRAVFQEGGHSVEALDRAAESGAAISISLNFLSKFMVPFEMTGLLILAAIMGAVILAKTHKAPGRNP